MCNQKLIPIHSNGEFNVNLPQILSTSNTFKHMITEKSDQQATVFIGRLLYIYELCLNVR